jgi:hypothetical protein
MSHGTTSFALLALALGGGGCAPDRDAPVAPEPPPGSEPIPAPAAEPVPPPDPPALPQPPAAPALESFTGQATHLGNGLRCAFYPLGWSSDGHFAYAEERMVNDMALEYGVRWATIDATTGVETTLHHWSSLDWDDGPPTLTDAWQASLEPLRAQLEQQGIAAYPEQQLSSLPLELATGTIDAAWTVTPVHELEHRAQLRVTAADGSGYTALDTAISTLVGAPAEPLALLSPDGAHALILAQVVRGEPVEALVDLDYQLFPLSSPPAPTAPARRPTEGP